MTFDTLLYERRDDGVATITLNRPQVLNAYNIQMRDDLFAALSAVRDDDEVRVLVMRGAGRAFCAGADLTEFGTAPSPTAARRIRFGRDVWRLLNGLSVPIIAALHGYVFGSGLEIALLCDVRVAAEGTQFGLPEVRLGMIPAAGGTQTLSPVIGVGPALDMLLTGRRIDSSEAQRLKLISRLAPADYLEAEVDTLARDLASRDPLVLRAIKQAVKGGRGLTMEQGLDLESRLVAILASARRR
jgi:enoyl-CoA hydratase/carnithine racemase